MFLLTKPINESILEKTLQNSKFDLAGANESI
jgi:hypothetical protein